MECFRCFGRGKIKDLGKERVCQTCKGTGEIPKEKETTKVYGKSFIKKFIVNKKLDFGEKLKKLKAIDFIGHPKLELQLLKGFKNYYIGKPDVSGFKYYKIPFESWEKFKFHYNKVYKKCPID